MMSSEVKYNKEELDLLNTNKGFKLLLSEKKLDYINTVKQLQYEKRKKELQIEMIKMQSWIVKRNKRLMIIFEGRDLAGKGGAIRTFAQHLNPRNMRMVALPEPTIMQRRQWYFRRYIQEFALPGEIVFFDRSWYNRAMVEPVNKFCSKNQYNKFMSEVNQFEEMIMNDGVHLIKIYFSITKDEQKRRLNEIKTNPLKKWKLSPIDHKALELWDEYTNYKNKMFEVTDRNNAPWIKIDANNTLDARLEAMDYVLSQVIYK
jgi:polyphosphate kinase 2